MTRSPAGDVLLGREVRFCLRMESRDPSTPADGMNNYAGWPRPGGFCAFYALTVELAGQVDERTSCVANIKRIDQVVREEFIPAVLKLFGKQVWEPANWLAAYWPYFFDLFSSGHATLDAFHLDWTPFHRLTYRGEGQMVYLTEKFEFCAAHRLWSDKLSDAENRAQFGKCTHAAGHGHNYRVEVTIKAGAGPEDGPAHNGGETFDIARLERIVQATVIEPLDHTNLNVDCPEFATLNPTVENICRVIWQRLADAGALGQALHAVRLHETEKTYAECRAG